LQNSAQLSRQIFNTNSNEKLPIFAKPPPVQLSSSVLLERHAHIEPDYLSLSKVDFDKSEHFQGCLLSPELKDTQELNQIVMDEGQANGSFLGYQSTSRVKARIHHVHSSSFDLYHRRQTPLRWSKKMAKGKKKFNLSLNNNKSLLLRPKLKGKNLKIDLLSQQQQVEAKSELAVESDKISFYHTGLTNEFETIKIGRESDKENKNIAITDPTSKPLSIMKKKPDKSNENPLMRQFRRKFEMQKCSSASHILKIPFNNNRISLSPIHNSKKLLVTTSPINLQPEIEKEKLDKGDLMNDSTDVSNMSSSTSNSSECDETGFEEPKQRLVPSKSIAFKDNSHLVQHMSDGYKCSINETNFR